MNETLKQRLVGLAVLLFLVFALSWLLPNNYPESGEKGVPSTTIPLAVNGGDAAPQEAHPELQPAQASPEAKIAPAPESGPPRAVDSSAPPLGAVPSKPAATPAAEIANALESVHSMKPYENPPAEEKPAPASKPADAKPAETKTADGKAPVLKLAQSLPAPSKTPAAATSAAKLAPLPPPPVPKLSTSVQAPPPAPKATAPAPQPAAKPATPSPAAPKPAAPAVAAAALPPPPAVAMAGQARIWFVQIGSFADQGNAQTTLSLLQNIGFRGESRQIAGSSGANLYRVRLGPFPSEAVAQQAQDKVAHQGYPQARVLSEPNAAR